MGTISFFILGLALGAAITAAWGARCRYKEHQTRVNRLYYANDLLRQRNNWIATAELNYQWGEVDEAVHALVESDKIMVEHHYYIKTQVLCMSDMSII